MSAVIEVFRRNMPCFGIYQKQEPETKVCGEGVYLGGYFRKHWRGGREPEIEKEKAIKCVLMKSLRTMWLDSAETPENCLAELFNPSEGALSFSSKAAISR